MGQMTKSTLLHIGSDGGGSAGFGDAKTRATSGLSAFEQPVWAQVKRGVVWSGVGQPDAESVTHTNALALNIGQAMMESGGAAMEAATLGFSKLEDNLRELNDHAKSFGSWVNEDGTVVWDENNPKKPTSIYDEDTIRQTNVQLAIQQTLKTATLLDHGTMASMQTVYDNAPEVVDNAADAAEALPSNKKTLVEALDARQQILEVSASFYLIDRNGLLGVADVKAAGGNPFADGVAEQVSELDKLVQGAIGLTKAGPLLNLLKADLPAIIVDGLLVKAGAAAAGAEAAGRKAAAEILKMPGRVLGVAGVAQFVADLAVFAAGKLAPDAQPTEFDVITHNGEPKATVGDQQLAGIASGYYSPTGIGNDQAESVADLAHLQRLDALPEGSEDFRAQAIETRDQLQAWLDEHPDMSTDTVYAQGLIEELDACIGQR
ncbi:MAG: hypothetical protein GEV10_00950 [Streptosporangiales bacterium]|nr:hypothetical protein [Streptosporangiales bacterium]